MEQLRTVGFYTLDGQSLTGHLDLRNTIRATPRPDEPLIIDYLNHGIAIGGVGGAAPDFLDHSLPIRLHMDIYTDGEWEWPAYLSYYVATYHSRLPDEFIAHLIRNNWVVPEVAIADASRKMVVL